MNSREVVQRSAGWQRSDAAVFVGHHERRAPCASSGPKTHEFAVLSFVSAGGGSMEQAGHWRVHPGDVMLVPAGAAHHGWSGDVSMWSVGLTPAVLLAEEQAHLLEPFERVRSGGAAVVHIAEARRGFVLELFAELARELSIAQAFDVRVRNSLLTLLISEVTRARTAAGDGRAAHDAGAHSRAHDDMVGSCLRFIEQHCLGPLTLQDVASSVRRSPAYLTTLLRRSTGLTAGQWIVAGRMAEARRRLLSSDERVDVIAGRVGYADATHFIRQFRRAHGVTPAAYRAGQRG